MFKVEIKGLDRAQRQIEDLAEASKELDGEITTVKFNAHDPESIESAIHQVEQAIDAKIARYRGNPMVAKMAAKMKATYRQRIIEKAQAARLKAKGE
jgi:saccharopine dehydrogenase-like NADP-dependent oxidoreductase